MPSFRDTYPNKYLSAADLNDEPLTLVIKDIEIETVGQGPDSDTKLCAYFKGQDKGLVLNKTNAQTIATLYGDDTDDWIGKAVTLFPTQVDFKGQTVDAIRIKNKPPKAAAKPAPAPVGKPAKPVTQAEVDRADDYDNDAPPF